MRLRAPAKVNLFLTVGARADGGLHEIVSVMQAVSLADEVALETAGDWTVTVEPPGAAPVGEANLALRAARAVAAAVGAGGGFAVHVAKSIPAAAGLGGGSADAAAALVGANTMCGGRLSRKALERIGGSIGSDVPFCVRGGTAIVAGTGDEVTSIPVVTTLWWVLAIPDEQLATRDVYGAFDRMGGGSVAEPHALADALARGDIPAIGASLRNDLEPAAASLAPSLTRRREGLLEAGALAAVMSGSGPAWCGLARDEGHARELASRLADAYARVEVVRSVGHGPRAV